MAINWTYPDQLALDLRNATTEFLALYERACVGTFELNGVTYPLPADALADIRSDVVAAYTDMDTAIEAIKAHATGA